MFSSTRNTPEEPAYEIGLRPSHFMQLLAKARGDKEIEATLFELAENSAANTLVAMGYQSPALMVHRSHTDGENLVITFRVPKNNPVQAKAWSEYCFVEVQVEIGIGLVTSISVDGKRAGVYVDLTTRPVPLIIAEDGELRRDSKKKELNGQYKEYQQRLLDAIRDRYGGPRPKSANESVQPASDSEQEEWRRESRKLQEQLLIIDLENEALKHCKKKGGKRTCLYSARFDVTYDKPSVRAGTGVVSVARIGWSASGNQDPLNNHDCFLEEWEYQYYVSILPRFQYLYELDDGYPVMKNRVEL